MPSEAYNTFTANLEYVWRILAPHKESSRPSKRGRPRLNHVNRSALIILCASWEQYIEDVVLNSVDELIKCTSTPLDLPKPVQKKISASVKNSKNELEPLKLAVTGGWEKTYRECAKQAIKDSRSPICESVNALLNQSIGANYTIFVPSTYSKDSGRLNGIINLRNQIAHQGVQNKKYIKLSQVRDSIGIINRLVTNTDNHLNKYLTGKHPNRIPPWD